MWKREKEKKEKGKIETKRENQKSKNQIWPFSFLIMEPTTDIVRRRLFFRQVGIYLTCIIIFNDMIDPNNQDFG